jgi:hypothetical protein
MDSIPVHYDAWMPTHSQRLCSAIDDLLSELDFDVPLFQQGSGLLHVLESHRLSHSFAESAPQSEGHSRSGIGDEGDITPNTSVAPTGSKLDPFIVSCDLHIGIRHTPSMASPVKVSNLSG